MTQEKLNQLLQISSKSTNVIVGCIYKHLTLPINDFTNEFIFPLKLQRESSKRMILLVLTLYYLIFLPTRMSKTSTLTHYNLVLLSCTP